MFESKLWFSKTVAINDLILVEVWFWSLFQLSGKTVSENLNLKFRKKFHHHFTNNGCLHCFILKALSSFYKTRGNFFFKMFNVSFLRSSKCLKTSWNLLVQPVELTQKLATEATASHPWYSCIVTVVSHYYDVVIL